MAEIRKDPFVLKALVWIFVILLVIYVGFPFYWMFISSIKSPSEVSLAPPTFWAENPRWANYLDIWTIIPLLRQLFNSVFITVTTVLVSIAMTSTTAYSLSRFHFKGRDFVIGLLLFIQLVPLVVYIIPLYFVLLHLHLINTYLGLIICYGAMGLPFMALVMRSYFKNAYPIELEEAAIIDGSSRFGTFLRIGLPLTRTGLIAVGTMTAINTWKEFLFASIVINTGPMKPVAIGIFDLVGQNGLSFTQMGLFMTACTIVVIPLIVAFLFVQRFIVAGIASGSIKG